MKRTWMFGIPTILLGVFSPDAEASTLHEWTLHERSAPLQIDGQHLANQVFFLDLGVQSIDRLNPVTGELEEWHPSTFVGGTPSSIEVDEAASPPVVFVSDPSSQQIGRLAPPNVYSYWPVAIPPIYQLRVLAVERVTGNVLFTSYDGVHAPVVASFDPARGTGRACILPPDAGEPSDRLDGIVALPSPATAPVLKAYFSVVGTKHRSIDLLDFSASTVTVWPVPLVDAGQIALTKTGQIASVLDGASSIAQLLDTSLSKYTWWQDAWKPVFVPFVSVMPGTNNPWFIGQAGPDVTRLDSTVPGTSVSVTATPFRVQCVPFQAGEKDEQVSSIPSKPPLVSPPMSINTVGAFQHHFSTSSVGAISAFNDDEVFITETAARRVAWLVP